MFGSICRVFGRCFVTAYLNEGTFYSWQNLGRLELFLHSSSPARDVYIVELSDSIVKVAA